MTTREERIRSFASLRRSACRCRWRGCRDRARACGARSITSRPAAERVLFSTSRRRSRTWPPRARRSGRSRRRPRPGSSATTSASAAGSGCSVFAVGPRHADRVGGEHFGVFPCGGWDQATCSRRFARTTGTPSKRNLSSHDARRAGGDTSLVHHAIVDVVSDGRPAFWRAEGTGFVTNGRCEIRSCRFFPARRASDRVGDAAAALQR